MRAKGRRTRVAWNTPVTEGEIGDVTVTCSPSSGSNFPTGTTPVQCDARDAESRSASCGFDVVVWERLKLSCPADRSVIGTTPLTRVGWSKPAIEGGIEKISVACEPSSGSEFAPGTTAVQCEAQDAIDQTASCDFGVTVRVPRISATTLVAFGDSLTLGFLRDPPRLFLVPSLAYPAQLQEILREKYFVQDISVINEGLGGETAEKGRVRLRGVLDRRKPDVLLILEGANLIQFISPSENASDLRGMVRDAQLRGVSVFLATQPPITNVKETDDPGRRAAIQALNVKIRSITAELAIPLVDLYTVMDGMTHLFGSDGFHPNPDGYRFMAQVFFDKIMKRLGEAPASLPVPYQLTDRDAGWPRVTASEDRFRLAPSYPSRVPAEHDPPDLVRERLGGQR